jgi:hypothetical protein
MARTPLQSTTLCLCLCLCLGMCLCLCLCLGMCLCLGLCLGLGMCLCLWSGSRTRCRRPARATGSSRLRKSCKTRRLPQPPKVHTSETERQRECVCACVSE